MDRWRSDKKCFPNLAVKPTVARKSKRKSHMIEFITNIPGPTFLIYFSTLAVGCILVAKFWANTDGSSEYPLAVHTELDPVAINVLRGESTTGIPSQHLEQIYQELGRLHLIRSGNDRFRVWVVALIMAVVIGGVGGTKLYFGITHGRPVLFLVLLLILSFNLLFRVLRPWEPTSQLGCRYLQVFEEDQGLDE
jgi:uncharacterized protein (TIGR04222 family)